MCLLHREIIRLFFFSSELMLAVDVVTVWSQNIFQRIPLCQKSRKIPCWLAEVTFPETLSQELWSSPLFRANSHCKTCQGSAAHLPPLCRTSAFGRGWKSNTEKAVVSDTMCCRGSGVASSFISCLSRSMIWEQIPSLHNCY